LVSKVTTKGDVALAEDMPITSNGSDRRIVKVLRSIRCLSGWTFRTKRMLLKTMGLKDVPDKIQAPFR